MSDQTADDAILRIIKGSYSPPTAAERRAEYMSALLSEDLAARLAAIDGLGEVGDDQSLAALRERLDTVGQEYQALIVAIGSLKWRLDNA